jgi:hypothetical protein
LTSWTTSEIVGAKPWDSTMSACVISDALKV